MNYEERSESLTRTRLTETEKYLNKINTDTCDELERGEEWTRVEESEYKKAMLEDMIKKIAKTHARMTEGESSEDKHCFPSTRSYEHMRDIHGDEEELKKFNRAVRRKRKK